MIDSVKLKPSICSVSNNVGNSINISILLIHKYWHLSNHIHFRVQTLSNICYRSTIDRFITVWRDCILTKSYQLLALLSCRINNDEFGIYMHVFCTLSIIYLSVKGIWYHFTFLQSIFEWYFEFVFIYSKLEYTDFQIGMGRVNILWTNS